MIDKEPCIFSQVSKLNLCQIRARWSLEWYIDVDVISLKTNEARAFHIILRLRDFWDNNTVIKRTRMLDAYTMPKSYASVHRPSRGKSVLGIEYWREKTALHDIKNAKIGASTKKRERSNYLQASGDHGIAGWHRLYDDMVNLGKHLLRSAFYMFKPYTGPPIECAPHDKLE